MAGELFPRAPLDGHSPISISQNWCVCILSISWSALTLLAYVENTQYLAPIISEHESDSEPNSITTHDIFQNSFPIENVANSNNITVRKPSKNDYNFDQLFLD